MDLTINFSGDHMYATIKGTVSSVKPSHIVIENNGIGYLILSPYPYQYHIGDEITCFVHHYIREDVDALYGFDTYDSKALFLKLIGVSGIGPKSALSILASPNVDETMYAIETGNIKFLTKFPGIGTKSAQQIILDLKGKLVNEEDGLIPAQEDDVTQALLALGYSKTEIRKTLKKINSDQSVEDMIKQALQLLIK